MNAAKIAVPVAGILLGLPLLVSAQSLAAANPWEIILKFFTIDSWLDRNDTVRLAAFVRMVIFFTVFAVFHGVMKNVYKDKLPSRASMVVAFALAAISSIFIRAELLLTIGEIYGAVLAWAVIGLTVYGIGYFLFGVITPGTGGTGMPRQLAWGLRLVGLALLYMVLSAVGDSFVPFV